MPIAPSHWTLRAKLLASVLALFTVVMLATSALTVLVTRSYLTARLAEDLRGATIRVDDALRGGRDGDDDGDGRVRPGGPIGAPGGGDLLILVLRPDGSVVDAGGVEQNAVVNEQGRDDVLDSAQVREVSDAATSSIPTRVEVGGDVGSYLISTQFFRDGSRVVVGVSTEPVEELQSRVLGVVVGGTAIGLVLVGVGGTVHDPPQPRPARPGRGHGTQGLGPQARLGPGGPCRAGAGAGRRRPHRGRPGRARAQHDARQRRVGPARPSGERDAGAPVRRGRQPRAAHPTGLDPRLRGADPARDRAGAADRHPRHRPGGVRGAAHAGARRGPAPARPPRLPAGRSSASRSTCRCSR